MILAILFLVQLPLRKSRHTKVKECVFILKVFLSAGAGGWLLALRTELHCEWELVTLTPAE